MIKIKNILSVFLFYTLVIYPQGKLVNYNIGIMKNLFNDVNINDASAACKIWVSDIGRSHNNDFTFDVKIFNDFEEVKEGFKNGNLAVLSLSISDYFKYKDKYKLEPIFVPSYKNRVDFGYLLLTKRESKYLKLTDLKGGKLEVSTNYDPQSSEMWFETICTENGINNKNKFFGELTNSPKESQLILNLFFGKSDACIVREKSFELMNELNPQIGQKLSPLIVSQDYLISVICFTMDPIPEDHKKIFIEEILDLHKYAYGKQFMTLMKIDKLILFRDEYIKTYRELLNKYNNLSNRKK